ncbi:hypothetical protein PG991_012310 [Apiospora marii]|uniref:Uncharacterized protein n=1 Tax=Apiospora marii TaxID=335849 RepID=A0ABR1R9H0_9PEZI
MPMEPRFGAPAYGPHTELWLVEHGDLYVHIQGQDASMRFLVDCESIERVSSIWYTLIKARRDRYGYLGHLSGAHGHWFGKLEVPIAGDPYYHYLLFRIIHKTRAPIPQTLTQWELYDLLVITEEYQISPSLLRPWVASWLEPYRAWPGPGPHEYTVDFLQGLYSRVWIAWVLGETEVFRQIVELLVREVSPGRIRGFLVSGIPLIMSPEIPDLFRYMEDARDTYVARLLYVFRKEIKEDREERFCSLQGRPDAEKSTCDLIVTRSIMRGYQDQVVAPAQGRERKESVKATYERLKRIQIVNFSSLMGDAPRTTPDGPTHDECCNPTARLHNEMDEVLSEPVFSYEVYREHLEQRAKATGLDQAEEKGTKRESED